jgi:hypothetical protein
VYLNVLPLHRNNMHVKVGKHRIIASALTSAAPVGLTVHDFLVPEARFDVRTSLYDQRGHEQA